MVTRSHINQQQIKALRMNTFQFELEHVLDIKSRSEQRTWLAEISSWVLLRLIWASLIITILALEKILIITTTLHQ